LIFAFRRVKIVFRFYFDVLYIGLIFCGFRDLLFYIFDFFFGKKRIVGILKIGSPAVAEKQCLLCRRAVCRVFGENTVCIFDEYSA